MLYAEDARLNQILMSELLGEAGIQVDFACDGYETLDCLKKTPAYDLLLLGIQIPGMDSFETARRIRQHEQQTGYRIPIVAVTAYAIKGDRERVLEAGMDDYITKPIDEDLLLRTIARHLPALDYSALIGSADTSRAASTPTVEPNAPAPVSDVAR